MAAATEEPESYFEEIKNDSDFITSRGIFIPVEKEEGVMNLSLSPFCACWSNLTEIESLFGGYEDIVIGFPYAGDDFMIIEFDCFFR